MSKYRAKTVGEVINESAGGAGGAGYAVWGGGTGRSFGNPSMKGFMTGRGYGFGASNTTGGPNTMYTYSIVPLNHELEQERTTQTKEEKYIHKGTLVEGYEFNSDDTIVGLVNNIVKDNDGNIKYYEVMDEETGVLRKLDPTTVAIKDQQQLIQPGVFDNPTDFAPN
ncbi:MAG: hypothetical protein ACOC22_00815 [bacterium]